ncbi:hypothetical protein HZU73_06936 [Apis mellifera caucasica]|nr:hypothetical protein HZU73_06936 [Apis mellifera caucasica]KAG9437465.1 hypothetical protein HZU67_00474 [Apis mellifera carnica]
MCSIIFQLFQVNGINIYKIGTFMIYLMLKLIQTFLYSWPGDVIFTESEFLRRNVYCSCWYDKNTSFAKYFLLVLAQRPIVLKACSLVQVTMDLLAKIMNTTISYYFLLETMNDDK